MPERTVPHMWTPGEIDTRIRDIVDGGSMEKQKLLDTLTRSLRINGIPLESAIQRTCIRNESGRVILKPQSVDNSGE